MAEVTLLVNGHSNPSVLRPAIMLQLDFLRVLGKPFEPVLPPDSAFISREEASRFLAAEARARRLWDAHLSPFRHLARFRWPQTPLFPAVPQYMVQREQLFHFVRGKWPIGGEDEGMHRAVAECLRYGTPLGMPTAIDGF